MPSPEFRDRLPFSSPDRLELHTSYAVTLLDEDGQYIPWQGGDYARCYRLWTLPMIGEPLRLYVANLFLRQAHAAEPSITNFKRLLAFSEDSGELHESGEVLHMERHPSSYRVETRHRIYAFILADIDLHLSEAGGAETPTTPPETGLAETKAPSVIKDFCHRIQEWLKQHIPWNF